MTSDRQPGGVAKTYGRKYVEFDTLPGAVRVALSGRVPPENRMRPDQGPGTSASRRSRAAPGQPTITATGLLAIGQVSPSVEYSSGTGSVVWAWDNHVGLRNGWRAVLISHRRRPLPKCGRRTRSAPAAPGI